MSLIDLQCKGNENFENAASRKSPAGQAGQNNYVMAKILKILGIPLAGNHGEVGAGLGTEVDDLIEAAVDVSKSLVE